MDEGLTMLELTMYHVYAMQGAQKIIIALFVTEARARAYIATQEGELHMERVAVDIHTGRGV